ncbi:MAG: diguanylate cyclase [Candidatus Nitricoxidivorans perseverans]|uniref:Diguanylate cyclase n=1 Tax=Candidatus Nitricoxidivorans perseverans TaxID=2975601 RepID=A0AA49FLF2_9PROT|nr:MAG: diguanylate cyclase [Candidatus Nitricoxidivorans perseverans]
MMQRFFAPAIALMNRLGYAQKFVLLAVVSLLAIAVVGISPHNNLDLLVGLSRQELKGLELVGPVSMTVQRVQEHRGMSAMLLAGHDGEALRDRRAAKAKAVDEAFGSLEGKISSGLALGDALRNIRADWESLRKEDSTRTAEESFDAHTRLVARVQAFGVDATDEYALTLDPEHATYYLIDTAVNKLPHAIEHLGQLRAYGATILARKQVSEAQKIRLHTLVAGLGDRLGELSINLEKVGRYNPEMRGQASDIATDIASSARLVTDLVGTDILAGRFATEPDAFFGMATASIDRSYEQLRESMVPMANALIRTRLSGAENLLYASLGVTLLLFLAVAYLMGSIYYAIASNVRSLARSAHAFAGGDTHERVHLDAHDELAQVGDSFNEMADGFNALIEEQHELSLHLEERVRKRTKELEQAQVEAGALLRRNHALMDTSLDGIHVMDLQGNVVEANDAFCAMLGYTQEEVKRLNVADWDVHFSKEELRAAFRNIIGNSAMIETRQRRKDGALIDVEISTSGIEIDGQVFIFAASRDITERKKAEEAIHTLAFHDPLTGLSNRRLLIERLQAALHASERRNNHGAVMFVDLDRFKSLNDAFGHDCGDLMLKEVAARIKTVVREMDAVARLGGDEFIVLVEDLGADRGEASRKAGLVAEKIREALMRPYLLDGHEHRGSSSIGICLFHGNGESANALIQHADRAMYQAKESGRNAVRFYDPAAQKP